MAIAALTQFLQYIVQRASLMIYYIYVERNS